MKPSKHLLLVLLFKCSLESLTLLPRAAKSLFPSPLPPQQQLGGHHLPSSPFTLSPRAQGVFSWLASGLKDTLKLFSAGKGDEHHHPLMLANATTMGTYHMPGDANPTPANPVSFLCSKPLLGIPKGDVSYGRLWKLYTAFNTQGVPLISLPPPAVRASTRLMYASGVCPNDTITHPDSAGKRCSEILMTCTKCTLQIFTDSKGRCFWIFSYKKVAEFLQ